MILGITNTCKVEERVSITVTVSFEKSFFCTESKGVCAEVPKNSVSKALASV